MGRLCFERKTEEDERGPERVACGPLSKFV
jgi:hypothetical protein